MFRYSSGHEVLGGTKNACWPNRKKGSTARYPGDLGASELIAFNFARGGRLYRGKTTHSATNRARGPDAAGTQRKQRERSGKQRERSGKQREATINNEKLFTID